MITLITTAQFSRMIGCPKTALIKAVEIGTHNIPKHSAELIRGEKTIVKLWNVNIAKKYVDKNRHNKPTTHKVPKEEVRTLYRNGFRSSDIAAKVGVSPTTVMKIVVNSNMKRVKKPSFFPPAHKIDKILSKMAIIKAVRG